MPVRDFSINTSLAASTLTPGITAPELSFTVPAMVLCAAPGGRNNIEIAKALTTFGASLNPVMGFFSIRRKLRRESDKKIPELTTNFD
jgi:hypothetical protein